MKIKSLQVIFASILATGVNLEVLKCDPVACLNQGVSLISTKNISNFLSTKLVVETTSNV